MRTHIDRLVAFLSLCVVAAGIASAAEIASIDRFHRLDDRVAIGGQPTPEQITDLGNAGFNGIINLREESEFNDGPQSHAARDAGIQFFRIPVSREQPSDAAVEKFLAVTDEPGIYPLYLYCASGNRAAALWMIRRVLRDGRPLPEAESEADRAGLSSATMRDFARDYIRRHAENREGPATK